MKTHKMNKLTTAILSAVLAGTVTADINAQEQQQETDVDKDKEQFGHIIVTTRKRAESLQDVPAAVSAFGADELEQMGISNLSEIQNITPNVTISETKGLNPGTIQVFIRGIGNDPGFDQGVGIYVDDVYLNRTAGALLDVYDIERIEVLKGPQGHLYGRNTIGGALKYVSRDPDGETRGNFEVKTGSDNLLKVRAGISGPLSEDGIFGGISVSSTSRDGYQNNVYDGSEFAGEDKLSARATLLYEPDDEFSIKFVADYHNDDSAPHVPRRIAINEEGLGTFQLLLTLANNFIPGSAYLAPGESIDMSMDPEIDNVNTEFVDGFNQFEIESTNMAVTAEWALNDNWSLKFVSALRSLENVQPYDFDGSHQTFIHTINYRDQEDTSQELQFNYTSDDVNGVIGLYYLDGDRSSVNSTTQTPLLRLLSSHVKDTTSENQFLTSTSVYGNFEWDISDDLKFSLGGRWTRDEKEIDFESDVTYTHHVAAFSTFTGPQAPMPLNPAFAETWSQMPFFTYFLPHFSAVDGSFLGMGNTETVEMYEEDKIGSASWSKFTPNATLSYKVDADTLLYAGITSGFKSGGFNVRGSAYEAPQFNPETVETLSLGFKSKFNDGTVLVNGEVFHNSYTEKQFATIALDDAGQLVQTTDNVGEVSSTGFELESMFMFPEVEGLSLNLNIGFLDNQIDKFIEQQETTPGSGEFVGVNVADRYELGFAPEWSAQGYLQYIQYIDEGDITYAIGAAYRGDSWTSSPIDITNDFAKQQFAESHTIFNSSLTYHSADGNWRVRLEGKNLTDERILVHSFNVSNVTLGGYTRGRTWELTFGYNF